MKLRTNIGVALILMVLAFASTEMVTAQTNNRNDTATTTRTDRDDDTDWGWLGLLGLAGLAGLIPKKRTVDVDRDTTNRTTGTVNR